MKRAAQVVGYQGIKAMPAAQDFFAKVLRRKRNLG